MKGQMWSPQIGFKGCFDGIVIVLRCDVVITYVGCILMYVDPPKYALKVPTRYTNNGEVM